jgi:hypothetical protein
VGIDQNEAKERGVSTRRRPARPKMPRAAGGELPRVAPFVPPVVAAVPQAPAVVKAPAPAELLSPLQLQKLLTRHLFTLNVQ